VETFHLFFQRVDWKTLEFFFSGVKLTNFSFIFGYFQLKKKKQETYSSLIQHKSIKEQLRW
jgi:hypothetical protein